MQILGTLHFALALLTLALGGILFARRKGDAAHRRLGLTYSGSLLAVNVTALSVYRDSSSFGPFHVLALVSLATLVAGFVPAFLRRPRRGWLELHAHLLSWSYVGLVAAGVSQLATSTLGGGATAVVVSSFGTTVVGGLCIHSRLPVAVAKLGPRDDAGRLRLGPTS